MILTLKMMMIFIIHLEIQMISFFYILLYPSFHFGTYIVAPTYSTRKIIRAGKLCL